MIQKAEQETKKSEKVSVQTLADGSVLWHLSAPEMLPRGLKMAIVKVSPRLWVECNRVRGEYIAMRPKIVLASLRRGDFKDLPIATQRQIRSKERVPAHVNRTCHHILPLALGGENEMRNICWLDDRVHTLLHQKFIAPYEAYMHGMVSVPPNLFFEIPVPQDTKVARYRLVQGTLQVVEPPAKLKKTLSNVSTEHPVDMRHKKKGKKQKGRRPIEDQNEA